MELGAHVGDIARKLLGEPNREQSTRHQLRFGRNGSVSVEIAGAKRRQWFDHENGVGGGPSMEAAGRENPACPTMLATARAVASTSPPTIKIPSLLSRSDVLSTEPSPKPGFSIVANGCPGPAAVPQMSKGARKGPNARSSASASVARWRKRAAKRREAAGSSNPSAVRRPIRQSSRGFDLIKASF